MRVSSRVGWTHTTVPQYGLESALSLQHCWEFSLLFLSASTWGCFRMESSNIPFASLSLSASFYGTADLEEPEFVQPDSKYECTACRKYLREPLQTTCGHRICRSCFEEELQKSGPDGFPCLAKEEECEVINQGKVSNKMPGNWSGGVYLPLPLSVF